MKKNYGGNPSLYVDPACLTFGNLFYLVGWETLPKPRPIFWKLDFVLVLVILTLNMFLQMGERKQLSAESA